MNCCDEYGDCRQGRDCPVRTTRVARIGRKDYAREELPPTVWPRHLRALCKWMLIVIFFLLYAGIMAAVIR
jgi:hypothetical protein